MPISQRARVAGGDYWMHDRLIEAHFNSNFGLLAREYNSINRYNATER